MVVLALDYGYHAQATQLKMVPNRHPHAHPGVGGEHPPNTEVYRRDLNTKMEKQKVLPNLYFTLPPFLKTVEQPQVAVNGPGTCCPESKSTSPCIHRYSRPAGPSETPVTLA